MRRQTVVPVIAVPDAIMLANSKANRIALGRFEPSGIG